MIYVGALIVFLAGYWAGCKDRKAARRISPELILSEEWAARQMRQ